MEIEILTFSVVMFVLFDQFNHFTICVCAGTKNSPLPRSSGATWVVVKCLTSLIKRKHESLCHAVLSYTKCLIAS